jgi:hypothetical protein
MLAFFAAISATGDMNPLGAAIVAIVLGLVGKTSPRGTATERQTPMWRAVMLSYKNEFTELLQLNKPALWRRGPRGFARVGAWIMADATDDKNVVTLTRANMIVGILVAIIALGTPAVSSLTYVLNLRFSVESLKQSQDSIRDTVINQQKIIEKLVDSDVARRTQAATIEAKLDQVLGRLK